MFRRLVMPLVGVSLIALGTLAPARADTVGFVRGTVSRDGRPVAAHVTLAGNALTLGTEAGSDGRFAFARVPFGDYHLAAKTADGRIAPALEIAVASGDVASVSLLVPGDRVIGRVDASSRGASGTPVSQSTIGAGLIAVLPNPESLASLVETAPGVVKFSYNEPVAHGFHGLIYELDGAPLPQSTSSNFAEIVDPRNVDSIEVFTGAFPAEFGGSRQGAVVNIVSKRPSDLGAQASGTLTLGVGSYGTAETRLAQSFALGSARIFVGASEAHSGRGLDSPTYVPNHDRSNLSDQFLRVLAPLSANTTLAFNYSNNYSAFQIPTNTTFNPNDPVISAAGTDDVQREYDRTASLAFTRTSRDGQGFIQIIPWTRASRIAYAGDLTNDIAAVTVDATGATTGTLAGLREDRTGRYTGLRISDFHASDRHAIKAGIDYSGEKFASNSFITTGTPPDLIDNAQRHGSQFGAYIQDKWSPSRALTMNAGVRYDRSTGFTSGNQISPRFELNLAPDQRNVVHFYYGRNYAAPALEDTRRDASALVLGNPSGSPLPTYDLQPQRDSYYEMGLAHTFGSTLHGSINYFSRNVANVLDTTQLANTPVFAVYNSTLGRDQGVETRFDGRAGNGDSFFLSATLSSSEASGISGGTFLIAPAQLAAIDASGFQPEDHDQTLAINGAYTRRFGATGYYATLEPQFGTGYPVQFLNGTGGRLSPHLTFDAAFGREPAPHRLGVGLGVTNLTNRSYLLKFNNGFNTSQWVAGTAITLRLIAPL